MIDRLLTVPTRILAVIAVLVVVVIVVLAVVLGGSGGHRAKTATPKVHGPGVEKTKPASAVPGVLTIKVVLDHGLRSRKYVVFAGFVSGRHTVLLRTLPRSGKLVLDALPVRTLAGQKLSSQVVVFTASPCEGNCAVYHGGISLGNVSLLKLPVTIKIAPRCRIVAKGKPPIVCEPTITSS